jgi:putative colanic acid biosynthesis UDP-glucose lipid carrier transferase
MMKTGNLRPYVPLLMNLNRLFDAVLTTGLFAGLAWYFGMLNEHGQIHAIIAVLIFFITLVCLHGTGVYRSWRIEPLLGEIRPLIYGCFMVFVLVLITIYFLKVSTKFSRLVMILWMTTLPFLLGLERLIIRSFLRHQRQTGRNIRSCVIAGAGDLGKRIAQSIINNPWSGSKLIGFFDDKVTEAVEALPVLGNLETIFAYVQQNQVDIVYLALPLRAESKIKRLVTELADSTASIYLVPDIFLFDLVLDATITSFGNLPIIALRETPLHGFNSVLKRAEDLVLAGIMLLISLPVMMVIAILIKLTSTGPAFFKQWRYGMNGQPIQVYKFRTMTVCEDGYDFKQATRDDPRVTPLGAFLRRASLDELPQIINVLQGSMSIVGPRPHPVAMNEMYRRLIPGYMLRHKIKPGLTGLAQVNGWRGGTDTLEKVRRRVECDLEYLRNWSILLDLKIIFKTFILWQDTAY